MSEIVSEMVLDPQVTEQTQGGVEAPKKEETKKERLKRLELQRGKDKKEFKEKQEQSNGVFKRPRIVHQQLFGASAKVELFVFDTAVACRGAPFVIGMPSNNMTSLLTNGYFAKQLNLPTVACLRIRGAAPEGIVKENVPYTQARILGNKNLCVLYSESPIKGGGTHFNFIQALLSFAKSYQLSHICIIDGVPISGEKLKENAEDSRKLRFVTTSEQFSAKMKEQGHIAVMNAIMPGFTGQMLVDASLDAALPETTNISCVLAMTDARIPNATSAVHVVKALDACIDTFTIDISDLEDAAMEMEHAVGELIAKAQTKMTQKAAPQHMYM